MKPGEVHPATHMPVVRYLQVVSDLLDGESRTCKGLDCGPATAYSRLRFSDETVGCVGQIAGDYRQRVAGDGRVLGIDGNMNRYESGPDELVFTTARGQQLRSTTFSRKHFRPAVEAADVPRPEDVRVHDLRQVSVTRSGPNRRRGGGLYRAPSQRVDLVFGKMSLTFRPRWTYRRMTGLGWARRGRLWRA